VGLVDVYYANGVDDLRAAALSSQIVEEPGIQFLYNSYNLLLTGMVLKNLAD